MWMLATGSMHSSPEKFQFRFCALTFIYFGFDPNYNVVICLGVKAIIK